MGQGLSTVRNALRRRILAAPLLVLFVAVCGVLWGGYFLWLSGAACAVAAVCCRWRVLIAALLCMAVAYLHLLKIEQQNNAFFQRVESASLLTVEGTVERALTNGCVLKDDASGARIVLRGEHSEHEAGARIRASIELLPSSPAPIAGMFDSQAWLRSQGLAASAYCTDAAYSAPVFSFACIRAWADKARAYLAARLIPDSHRDDPRAQVLSALVLGDKSYSEPETVDTFKRGGCLHIFAVSGLHVGIIAGIVYFILSRFMLRSRMRTVLLLLITALYVVMTGLAVPALRAFLMLALIMTGRELRRPVSMVNIWAAAALLILLLSPWQIHHAGFWLSFAVYGAIGIGVRYGMRSGAWLRPDSFVPPRIYNGRERFVVQADLWLRGVVLVSVSAWLVALPISMGYFHSFNLYGVILNIIITPLLMPAMLCGLLSLLPCIGVYLHGLALAFSGVLLGTVGVFADLPSAYLPLQAPRGADAVMVYHTGYGDSFCVLGNPGVLINCGSDKTVRFTTYPALFHGGFSPALLLLTQKRASCSGGKDTLLHHLPQLQVIESWQMKDDIRVYKTSAGTVTVVFPSSALNRTPVQNANPIVLWEGKARRVLYVGDASLLTFERIPETLLNTDTVICGRNPALPVTPRDVAAVLPSAQIILLPSAAGFDASDLPDSPALPILRVGGNMPCLISDGNAERAQ